MAVSGHCCIFTLFLFLGIVKCTVLRNNSIFDAAYKCGTRQIKPYPTTLQGSLGITNGKEVRPEHSQPWVVGFVDKHFRKQECGGTLIHSKFVLSAFHCFEEPEQRIDKMYAVLGLHYHANSVHAQYIKIKAHFPDPRRLEHPEHDHDLVLLELEDYA